MRRGTISEYFLFIGTNHNQRNRAASNRKDRLRARRLGQAIAEEVEARVLLSAYTLKSLGSFVPFPQGEQPSGLVVDAAGDLFGTTSAGGTNGNGNVFEIPHASPSTFTTLASFSVSGSEPTGNLVVDSSGDLFGVTFRGGTAGEGSVFEVSHSNPTTITTLASFTGSNGANPAAGMTIDSSGNLFGTTSSAGPNGNGTVFEISTAAPTTITTLASFTDGGQPEGALAIDSSGDLFGTTTRGGTDGRGSVFEIAHATPTTITTLASFPQDGSHGTVPDDGLVLDSSGDIYGATASGGASGNGSVFELALNSPTTITTLATFNGTNGADPYGRLVIDSSGNLFGTTIGDGTPNNLGTVFEVAAASRSTITTLVTLNDGGGIDGAGLAIDSSGNLYGARDDTTTNGYVFEIPQSAPTTLTTLATFASTAGSNPNGPLLLGSDGNLYGTTSAGGAFDDGTIYEIPANDPTNITVLASFNGTDGLEPIGNLAMDASGNIYGATAGGGSGGGYGTIFEFNPSAPTTITTLASFTRDTTTNPTGVVMDSNGNLFGTTTDGALEENGAVFEISKSSPSTITTLAEFSAGQNGSDVSSLAIDSSGNLYGTIAGSFPPYPYGAVFEVPHATLTTITPLIQFNDSDGAYPKAGLTLDAAGNLYGTTSEFSNGNSGGSGTVFEIAQSTPTTITTLATTGSYAAVALDSNGNLFGTTYADGSSSLGTVFEIPHATPGTLTTLASFNGADGSNPTLGLTVDANGDIFGVTRTGGSANSGAAFELIPQNQSAPSITTQPAGQTTTAGDAVTFSAVAAGSPTPTVQWQVSADGGATFTNIAGATAAAYGFTTTVGETGHQYRAVFTNNQGIATTSAAVLTVTPATTLAAPVVTTGPANQTVFPGNAVVLTAAASGNPTPTVQWQVSNNAGATFSDISGATTSSYSFTATAGQGGNEYQAVFTNSQGSATSGAATLTVLTSSSLAAPVVSTNPTSQGVAAGASVTLTAAASGNPTPTVQWQVSTDGGNSFSTISGATAATYSFTVTSGESGHEYEAVFTNSQGSVTTNAAVIVSVGGSPLANNSSLTPTIVGGRLPIASLVAGNKIVPITQSIRITNTSASTITGTATISLLLSNDSTGNSGGTSAASLTRKLVNLKPGKFVTVPVTIRSLPAGETGSLYILPQVTDPDGGTAFTASGSTITVASPFIDLQPLVVHAPATVKAGKKGTITLTLINNGNIAAGGSLDIDLQASTTGVIDSNSVDLGTVTRPHVLIGAGKKLTLSLTETFPTTGGPYFIVADVDPANTFNESIVSNNLLASVTTVKLK